MPQFAILATVALFAAFYQLSGGSDFQPGWPEGTGPGSIGPASLNPAVETLAQADSPSPEVSQPIRAATAAPVATPAAEPAMVQTVGFAAASGNAQVVQAVQHSEGAAPEQPTLQISARTQAIIERQSLARRQSVERVQAAAEAAHEAKLASQQDAPQGADMRQVSGDRVNLRYGPGTRFSILTTLEEGDKVEVIASEGDWVQLRVPETGRTGWMANSLVTDAG
ncbi:SH3 domain-containing protein [Pseudooceanicola algae]|uniref:Uncharacterized protein n=1 Tax=Pseudooceanicola algae TaxID=1537215 RepID=A0A418SL84_9RHOB|nr:SH3 domain-containing protein [Pseudooceanicola algae]QPM90820.1 hypothetical protein PSAL_020610 [Pseudooceanicola algae]